MLPRARLGNRSPSPVPLAPRPPRRRGLAAFAAGALSVGLLAALPAGAADRTAISGITNASSGLNYGALGTSASTTDGSVGAVGESTATSGFVAGVIGRSQSTDGAAALFTVFGTGDLLRCSSAGVPVFQVDHAGVATVVDLFGSGDGLTALGDFDCPGPCLVSDTVFAPGGLAAADLASGAVGTAQLQTAAVNTDDLAGQAVTTAALADGAVDTTVIADDSVAGIDIALGGVASVDILDGAINTAKLADDSLRRSDIDGTEVQVYATHSSCSDPQELTLVSTCLSRVCGPGLFLNCNNVCNAATPQLCTSPLYGYLLAPDIGD